VGAKEGFPIEARKKRESKPRASERSREICAEKNVNNSIVQK
jgi:hypothetical protein